MSTWGSTMTWYPHVTVASIIENDGKFLFVEEVANGKRVINQPAGHLEAEETLIEAAQRETLEETQWQVAIDGVVGMGLYVAPGNGVTYHRSCFFGRPLAFCPESLLDTDIKDVLWLSVDDVRQRKEMLRSPLVLDNLERYLAGHRYPLSMMF
jgi:8-oxo-dGTP pyrophosphatase MutT (NUDIX family)